MDVTFIKRNPIAHRSFNSTLFKKNKSFNICGWMNFSTSKLWLKNYSSITRVQNV